MSTISSRYTAPHRRGWRGKAAIFFGVVALFAVSVPAASAQHWQLPIFDGSVPLAIIGGPEEDAHRVGRLLAGDDPGNVLIRSPSAATQLSAASDGAVTIGLIEPEIRTVWNSAIPYSLNQGALWAGKGLSTQVIAGARLRSGRVTLTVAPQLVHIQNRPFYFMPGRAAGRSDFSSPWYIEDDFSMDLPHRFGNQPITLLDLGQSALTIDAGPVAVGGATENQWWGPGIRNALVMSNHAPGFPHLFLRSARPLESRVGALEFKWIVGGLSESLYFDADPTNDTRSLSGGVVTFTPAFERDLTLGAARTVVAHTEDVGRVLGNSFDLFTRWAADDADELTSLFFRWAFPGRGVEAYAEWARVLQPSSFREFLVAPHHTQGYTVGLQVARPLGPGALRAQGEVTYLEMSPTYRQADVPTFYVGRNVEHGYTHRGRVIGAAIGPGSSSQWIATDYLHDDWRAGIFAGRIRWENDAYYLQPAGFGFWSHDVSVLAGVRGGIRTSYADLMLEFTAMHRYNYLFQNHGGGYGPDATYDRGNFTIDVRITPRFGRSATPLNTQDAQ